MIVAIIWNFSFYYNKININKWRKILSCSWVMLILLNIQILSILGWKVGILICKEGLRRWVYRCITIQWVIINRFCCLLPKILKTLSLTKSSIHLISLRPRVWVREWGRGSNLILLQLSRTMLKSRHGMTTCFTSRSSINCSRLLRTR